MLPQITIFGIELSTYTLITGFSYLVCVIITLIESKRYSINITRSLFACLILVGSAVIGSKVLFIIQSFLFNRESFSTSGFSLFGGLILAPFMIILYQKILHDDNRILNSCTIGTFVCLAIGKIGCFCAGCCNGEVSFWGISLPNEVGITRIPIQLIECFFTFIVVILLILLQKSKPSQNLYMIGMLGYCSFRFCCEFLRAEAPVLLHLTNGQIISLCCIIVIIIYMALKNLITNKRKGLDVV